MNQSGLTRPFTAFVRPPSAPPPSVPVAASAKSVPTRTSGFMPRSLAQRLAQSHDSVPLAKAFAVAS